VQNGVVTLAARVFAASYLTGTFVLRSGRTADHYFDKYRFESDPALLREIVDALVPLVPAGTEGLAGLELGGVPLATMLSSPVCRLTSSASSPRNTAPSGSARAAKSRGGVS
jgi:orotate phosphoribosyltransferase